MKRKNISSNIVDYTALLEKAKILNAKVQKAKDHACYVQIAPTNAKTCAKANDAFYAAKKEYKLWKKNNIDKHGLILNTAGDCEEPIGILAVLAGAWSMPMKRENARYIVDYELSNH